MDTEQKLDLIKRILNEKKAENAEVIDVSGRTLMADYFVVCSGTSSVHIKAIADGLLRDAKSEGLKKYGVEGHVQAKWVLVDYGDVIVHIFAPEEREFYDIESLWKETAAKLESAAN